MKYNETIEATLVLLAAIALVALGMCIQHTVQRTPAPVDFMKPDTTYIHDTTYILDPIPVLMYADRTEIQLIDSSDIVIKGDSLIVPIETKVYEEKEFRAVVEGYHPKLKELEIYRTDMQITQPVMARNSRWSLGVTFGPAFTQDGVSPAVVIGATYNLKTFQVKRK